MSEAAVTVLGLDVGGTKIAAGLVSFPEGRVLSRRSIPTRPERGGAAVLEEVFSLSAALAREAAGSGRALSAIGLGLCELVGPDETILSSHCIRWQNQPARERLSGVAPLAIEADARAAALAEGIFGAGRAFRVFLYVTIGTGISCCLMQSGQPFLGARGLAGTMASSPLWMPPEKRGAASPPALEEIASGPALAARWNQRHPGADQSAQDVLAAAAAGDREAIEIARSAGEAMGAALGHLVNVLDPEAVVVGGGLGLAEGLYWNSLAATARAHIWSPLHRDLPIMRAQLGADAGIIGAAAAAWKKHAPSHLSSVVQAPSPIFLSGIPN